MDELPIIRHDDHLAWVEKPPGMLSVPGKGETKRDSVVTRLAERFGWAREVHRLDMDTSGVMVVALTPDAHRDLSRQFRERRVVKRYEAIVSGCVADRCGRIDLPLRLDVERRPRQVVDRVHGRPSFTEYDVLERRSDGTTRLTLAPLTGRSHQLRVHLAAIGHPILGDDLYTPPHVSRSTDRLHLHATYLEVTHPATAGDTDLPWRGAHFLRDSAQFLRESETAQSVDLERAESPYRRIAVASPCPF